MTLRDIGDQIGNLWASILTDLETVSTSNPLDWPIWIFFAGAFLAFIVVPTLVGLIGAGIVEYLRDEPPMGLPWVLVFGIGAGLCALATFDIFASKTVFDGEGGAPIFLRIAYPIMTTVFGFSFVVEARKWLRAR